MNDEIILKEAARLTGYTTRHLAYLLRKGEIVGHKLGTFWIISKAGIEQYTARAEHENDGRFGPRKAARNG